MNESVASGARLCSISAGGERTTPSGSSAQACAHAPLILVTRREIAATEGTSP